MMQWRRHRNGMLAALALSLTACATTTAPEMQTSSSAVQAELTDSERRARIRLQLAVSYYQQGQLPTAIEELRVAIQADPRLADAYSVRGLIQMELGENVLAEQSFQQALKLSSNNPDYSNNYGWFLCQNGRETESIRYFESAASNRSYQSPAKAYRNAGVCSLKLKNNVAAEEFLSASFRIDPADVTTNLSLAQLYWAKRDVQQAHFYIGRVIKADALTADALWLAIRVERKLGNRAAKESLAAQLRRRYPASSEFAALQRGMFDE